MPCPHYKIKISKRAKGQSAVAQAAYQSGERLFDERNNRTKYYSDKQIDEFFRTLFQLPEVVNILQWIKEQTDEQPETR